MDCERAQALLSEYLEEGAAGAEIPRVAAHLEGCPECAAAAQGLKATLALLGNLPRHPAPPELLGNVLRRIAAEETAAPARKGLLRSARLRIPLEAAAAVLLLLLAYGIYDLRRGPAVAPSGTAGAPVAGAPAGETALPIRSGAVREDRGRASEGAAEKGAPGGRGAARPSAAEERGGKPVLEAATAAPEKVAKAPAPRPGRVAAPPMTAPARLAATEPASPDRPRPDLRRPEARLAVPAARASSLAEPVTPPAGGADSRTSDRMRVLASSPRLHWTVTVGREVILEVPPQGREGIEERIAKAAMRHGGSVRGDEAGRAATEGTDAAAAPMRVHLPASAADAFLDDLRSMGTIPPEGDPAAAGVPAGLAPDFVSYAVRIRVR